MEKHRQFLDQLLREAKNLQTRLSSSPSSLAIAKALFVCYHKLILADFGVSYKAGIFEKIWFACLYPLIDSFRRQQSLDQLHRDNMIEFIQQAISVFDKIIDRIKTKYSVSNIRNKCESSKAIHGFDACQSIYGFVGDLYRYLDEFDVPSEKSSSWLQMANQAYLNAFVMKYDDARVLHQLGYVSALEKNHLDALFWFALCSNAQEKPFTNLRQSLIVFYGDAKSNEKCTWIKNFIEFHERLFAKVDLDSLTHRTLLDEMSKSCIEWPLDTSIKVAFINIFFLDYYNKDALLYSKLRAFHAVFIEALPLNKPNLELIPTLTYVVYEKKIPLQSIIKESVFKIAERFDGQNIFQLLAESIVLTDEDAIKMRELYIRKDIETTKETREVTLSSTTTSRQSHLKSSTSVLADEITPVPSKHALFEEHSGGEVSETIQQLKAKREQLLAHLSKKEAPPSKQKPRSIYPTSTILILDTNCYISDPAFIESKLLNEFFLLIPIIVATELAGLQHASSQIWLDKLETLMKSSQSCRSMTTQGTYLTTLAYNEIHTAEVNDDAILQCVEVAQHHIPNAFCRWYEIHFEQPFPRETIVRVVLITNDTNLRVKACAKQVEVMSLMELKRHLR